MESLTPEAPRSQQPLRAMIEIINGNLKNFPVADSDADERRILDALRSVREELA